MRTGDRVKISHKALKGDGQFYTYTKVTSEGYITREDAPKVFVNFDLIYDTNKGLGPPRGNGEFVIQREYLEVIEPREIIEQYKL